MPELQTYFVTLQRFLISVFDGAREESDASIVTNTRLVMIAVIGFSLIQIQVSLIRSAPSDGAFSKFATNKDFTHNANMRNFIASARKNSALQQGGSKMAFLDKELQIEFAAKETRIAA